MIKICPQCKLEYKAPRKGTKFCAAECYYLSKIGKTPWNKGKYGYLTEKSRQAMSENMKNRIPWNKGKPIKNNNIFDTYSKTHDVWNKGRKYIEISGEKHWNWQGGITSLNKQIRNSFEFKQWREQVFKRDDYTCQLCARKRKTGDRVILQADHIKPFATHPESRLDVSNGRTLCYECHLNTETYGGRLQKQLFLNINQ